MQADFMGALSELVYFIFKKYILFNSSKLEGNAPIIRCCEFQHI